jgi:hypothetical protein
MILRMTFFPSSVFNIFWRIIQNKSIVKMEQRDWKYRPVMISFFYQILCWYKDQHCLEKQKLLQKIKIKITFWMKTTIKKIKTTINSH